MRSEPQQRKRHGLVLFAPLLYLVLCLGVFSTPIPAAADPGLSLDKSDIVPCTLFGGDDEPKGAALFIAAAGWEMSTPASATLPRSAPVTRALSAMSRPQCARGPPRPENLPS